jgi:hypothetical protein
MRRRAPLIGLLLVAAALTGGLTLIFRLRLAQGDVFPPYSSLRADPLGLRALHDSLEQLPGLRVERSLRAIRKLEAGPERTILLAGLHPQRWERLRREDFEAIDGAARAGARVVVALRAEEVDEGAERRQAALEAETRARQKRAEAGEPERRKIDYAETRRRWGVGLKARRLVASRDGAVAADEAQAAGLPELVPWKSDVYFELEADAGWRVLYRRAMEPVLAERRLGRGSLVLVADSYFLSNEALQRERAPALLAWAIGPPAHVVFAEAHLGVVAEPGVAALARRYGLAGAFFTLLLLAVLFVWQRLAGFVPPAATATAEDAPLSYHPAAGLAALLRRAVAPADLVATCVREWQPTVRDSNRARVAAALAAAPRGAEPVTLYNAAVRALQRR